MEMQWFCIQLRTIAIEDSLLIASAVPIAIAMVLLPCRIGGSTSILGFARHGEKKKHRTQKPRKKTKKYKIIM